MRNSTAIIIVIIVTVIGSLFIEYVNPSNYVCYWIGLIAGGIIGMLAYESADS